MNTFTHDGPPFEFDKFRRSADWPGLRSWKKRRKLTKNPHDSTSPLTPRLSGRVVKIANAHNCGRMAESAGLDCGRPRRHFCMTLQYGGPCEYVGWTANLTPNGFEFRTFDCQLGIG